MTVQACMKFFGKPSRANFCTTFMPDSEQIEHVIAEQFMRNSVSVEQIQDGVSEGRVRGQILIRLRNKLDAVAINGYASAFTLCSGFAMTEIPIPSKGKKDGAEFHSAPSNIISAKSSRGSRRTSIT